MGFIIWDNNYSVKIEEMDNQHKKIIEIINKLYDAMKEGKGKEIIGSIINDMIDYTKFHFKDEEELLEKNRYPDINLQYSAHKEFVNKIEEFQLKLKNNPTFLSIEVLNFLKDWLLNHISYADKKYGEFINQNMKR